MPELPEITVLARQLARELPRFVISEVHVTQPRCLNLAPAEFAAAVSGQRLLSSEPRGKWIVSRLSPGEGDADSVQLLALNLGMGGEVMLHRSQERFSGRKVAVRLNLSDGYALSIGFWWFGHVHLVPREPAGDHPVHGLGPGALQISRADFGALLRRHPATRIKALVCDQKRLAGIGNVYNQDALWAAGIHPLRKAGTVSEAEADVLYGSMREVLEDAIACGGSNNELDLFGERGGYGRARFQVAYRAGAPCPRCATTIAKIKTGSTSSYICPRCQPESPTLTAL